ncbi:MAG: Unknown protein [uncultured Sulfurovum sp.]|uniref:Organic solvent tolerance-like N-terminal domain-containing protein n=1 Tax=uncultured Sulfurovum sp. TaxID=269237 RepID=A0A6S6T4Z6_9BACT|nr:MAG: Unknown protein [uncultured Sulfurovum sp.]
MRLAVVIFCSCLILFANDADWDASDTWGSTVEESNTNILFEKAKIENRSKRNYSDKVYKYITGDYEVENNTIELGTIRLNDNLQNEDVSINVYTDNLDVEGNSYKDGIDLKRNKYKNFVNNDEGRLSSFGILEGEPNPDYGDTELSPMVEEESFGLVSRESSRYDKVIDEDISEIEEIDLREENDLKEVNVLIEDVNIFVD